jgi:spore coat protein H
MLETCSNAMDAGRMNETLAYRLYRSTGVPAPRTAFAKVYLTIPRKQPRKYLGLYSLVENIDRDFLAYRFGTRAGALFKPDTRRLFEDKGDDWSAYRSDYDPKTDIDPNAAQRVIALSKLVSHAGDTEFASRLEQFLDVEEFARFMAVTVWLSSMDSLLFMGHNYVVYLHPETNRFQFIPWDLDLSFGRMPVFGENQPAELNIHRPWIGRMLFLERVFRVEAFKIAYLAQLRELNEAAIGPEGLRAQVEQLDALLRPAVAQESAEELARFEDAIVGGVDNQWLPADLPAPLPPFIVCLRIVSASVPGPPGAPRFPVEMKPHSPPPIRTFTALRSASIRRQLNIEQVDSGLTVGHQRRSTTFPDAPRRHESTSPGTSPGNRRSSTDAQCQKIAADLASWFEDCDKDGSGDLTTEEILSETMNELDRMARRRPAVQGATPSAPEGAINAP